MPYLFHAVLSFFKFIFKSLYSLLRHFLLACYYLGKWSWRMLLSVLYLTARCLSFPFRMCFPNDDIDRMDGVDFEHFAAKWLRYSGYKKIQTTPITADYGVDLICVKDGVKYGVQCKRYRESVGISAVQEISAGIAYYGCDKGMVFTNSSLTRSAKNLAEANGIDVIDGEYLQSTQAAELITRSKASLILSEIFMSLLFLAFLGLSIVCFFKNRTLMLLPLFLSLLSLIAISNNHTALKKRDEQNSALSSSAGTVK